jgi:hypothetical protein
MKLYLIALCTLLALSAYPLAAQKAPLSDAEIRRLLVAGSKEERSDFFHSIGLDDRRIKWLSDFGEDTTHGPDEWDKLKPISSTPARILFFPCRDFFGEASITLLTAEAGSWKIRDSQSFDCHYDYNVSLQLLEFTSRSQYDILIRHACEGRGTGYVEQSTQLFRVSHLKLALALDETDKKHLFPPGRDGYEEESTFLATGKQTLEQTRTVTSFDKNQEPRIDQERVERRTFQWSSASSSFHKSAWNRLR